MSPRFYANETPGGVWERGGVGVEEGGGHQGSTAHRKKKKKNNPNPTQQRMLQEDSMDRNMQMSGGRWVP